MIEPTAGPTTVTTHAPAGDSNLAFNKFVEFLRRNSSRPCGGQQHTTLAITLRPLDR